MDAPKVTDLLISRNKTKNKRCSCAVHYHDTYELYFMQQGRTTYFIDGEIYSVEKGDFVFVPRGILHRTDSGDCTNNARILLNIQASVFTPETEALLPELCRYPVISVREDKVAVLEELLIKIEMESRKQDPYQELLIELYIQTLLTLICRYRCERKRQIRESDQIIYRISEYIGQNYDQDISLRQISRLFSISESYLSRKFKSVTGIGISQYITCVRISNAEKLLKRGEVSVAEAARQCGYNDTNYFSLVFKRIQGVTPFQMAKNRMGVSD